jgi:MoaA/NifB/PqqE/SkfB family radical SAM enzyme
VSALIKNMNAFFNPSQVGYLICFVTSRCNMDCSFCFLPTEVRRGAKPDELTLEEYEALNIGPLVQLSLTGGEPFLRPDFQQVAHALIKHTTPRFVTIPSNGWFTDKILSFFTSTLKRFSKTSFRLVLSIDAIGDKHDVLRKSPGAFNRLVQTYEAMLAVRARFGNLVLDANSVLGPYNVDTLFETLVTLDKDFQFDNLAVNFERSTAASPADLPKYRSVYRQIADFLQNRARRRENRFMSPLWRAYDLMTYDYLERTVFDDQFCLPCVAGKKLVVLGQTGDVHPCEVLGVSTGNVRDYGLDLKKLLDSQQHQDQVKWIADTKCKCGWECALAANIVWNLSSYPKLLGRIKF